MSPTHKMAIHSTNRFNKRRNWAVCFHSNSAKIEENVGGEWHVTSCVLLLLLLLIRGDGWRGERGEGTIFGMKLNSYEGCIPEYLLISLYWSVHRTGFPSSIIIIVEHFNYDCYQICIQTSWHQQWTTYFQIIYFFSLFLHACAWTGSRERRGMDGSEWADMQGSLVKNHSWEMSCNSAIEIVESEMYF